MQGAQRILVPDKTRIAPGLADGAQYACHPQLLQDVCITQQDAFNAAGIFGRQVLADGLHDEGDFVAREIHLFQQGRRLFHGIFHIVPGSQGCWIRRPVADENAQVVQPCGGMQDIVIIALLLRQAARQRIQPGLVAEFIGRQRCPPDIVFNRVAVNHGHRHR